MKPTAGAQAVHRAAGLLKAFTRERPSLGLAELSAAVGLHRSTAHRLLAALEAEGLVDRSADGGYRLGPEMLALGSRALGAADLREACRAELIELAAATHETATVEILIGGEVLILDEVTGDHRIGSMPSIGTRWPAHATSTGKVLLAHLDPSRLETLLREPLAAPTPRTVTSTRSLRRELDASRQRGWALSDGELEAGYVAIGAPVRGADGEVVAALSLGGPERRLAASRHPGLARRVCAAARGVSERLGFRSSHAGPGPVQGSPS